MRAAAERNARLDVQHRAAERVIIVDPDGTDEQPLADRHGLEERLPVVLPVLVAADCPIHLKGDALGSQTLAQIRDSLGGIVLGGNIQVDDRLAAVFLQKLLVDQVNVRNVVRFLFEMAVVLHVDAAARRHTGDVADRIRVPDVHRQNDFRKVHSVLHGK